MGTYTLRDSKKQINESYRHTKQEIGIIDNWECHNRREYIKINKKKTHTTWIRKQQESEQELLCGHD